MRRLIVLRHAKSDWDAGASNDHERPLNKRGLREAPSTAAQLLELGFVPDYITSSDSTRTRETLEAMRPCFDSVPVQFDRRFYLTDLDAVRELAAELPADVRTWMIVGHNPGWEDLVSVLTQTQVEMKTAYAAVLEGEAERFDQLLVGRVLTLAKLVVPAG